MTEKPEDAGAPVERAAAGKRKSAAKPAKAAKKRTKRARSRKPAATKPDGGRPAWAPTPEERMTIEQMKFCGESETVIARSLKVDVKTLKKHCANELENGHANRRREVIGLMFSTAKAGNASAIRRLEEIGRVAGAAEALKERTESGGKPVAPAAVQKPVKLGKKAERRAAAEVVAAPGNMFAPPPAPARLVVDNS
jgi:hypothetical protein